MSLPDQLKAAREAKSWTIEEVGQQLRLPAKIIAQIESGDYQSLGAPIYQRGYLMSFARLVDVPASSVEEALAKSDQVEPELVATGVVPRGAHVAERYLRAATYIALTALIAAPVVWYAASGRLSEELASFEIRQQGLADDAGTPLARTPLAPGSSDVLRASILPDMTPARPGPLVSPDLAGIESAATQAPVVSGDHANGLAAGQADASGNDDAAGSHSVGSGQHLAELELSAESWVEVLAADGRTIERAVLRPGRWQFRSDGGMSLTIGNSLEATLRADGRTVDLSTSRSPNNVARVQLFSGATSDG